MSISYNDSLEILNKIINTFNCIKEDNYYIDEYSINNNIYIMHKQIENLFINYFNLFDEILSEEFNDYTTDLLNLLSRFTDSIKDHNEKVNVYKEIILLIFNKTNLNFHKKIFLFSSFPRYYKILFKDDCYDLLNKKENFISNKITKYLLDLSENGINYIYSLEEDLNHTAFYFLGLNSNEINMLFKKEIINDIFIKDNCLFYIRDEDECIHNTKYDFLRSMINHYIKNLLTYNNEIYKIYKIVYYYKGLYLDGIKIFEENNDLGYLNDYLFRYFNKVFLFYLNKKDKIFKERFYEILMIEKLKEKNE